MRRTVCVATVAALLAMTFGCALGAAVPADQLEKVKAALPDKAYAKPKKARKLLVFTLTKGFRHSSIEIGAEALKLMGEKTGAWETTITDDVEIFTADKLKAFDAVCINNCTGTLFKEEDKKAALLDFVRGGKGIIGIHAATDCFYDWKEYGEMMGGYFDGHPFRDISVKLDDPKNPINQMFEGEGFKISDEIYTFKEPYSREALHLLLSIDAPHTKLGEKKREDEDYAVSWIRQNEKGRTFYCSLGHEHYIFWNPTILKHYLAGVQYALGDIAADATPSAKLKIEPARGPNLKENAAANAPKTVVFAAPKDEKDGWIALFDGKDLSQWQNAGGDKPGAGWVVEDGAMVRQGGGGDIWTKERFGDFILDLEFKTEGNSGVFIRTDNPKDCVQTGIEMQVDRGGGKEELGRNGVGSIYDCLAPSKNPVKDGDWNHVVLTTKDNKIEIEINGEKVINMDLDKWTEAHKNPDGSGNKFNKALKDFKREGHIGFQDHGAKVMYRNVKVKPIGEAKK